jgi:hypothetical protein
MRTQYVPAMVSASVDARLMLAEAVRQDYSDCAANTLIKVTNQ